MVSLVNALDNDAHMLTFVLAAKQLLWTAQR